MMVAIEPDGNYRKVVAVMTGEVLMTGLDDDGHAHRWAASEGHEVVALDEEPQEEPPRHTRICPSCRETIALMGSCLNCD